MSEKGIKEGPPIWVESLMTAAEWRERHKKFPTSPEKEPPQFNPKHYEGGRWRAGMGSTLSKEQIEKINKGIDEIREYLLTQQHEHKEG